MSLFVGEFVAFNLAALVGALFVVAMVLMIAGLVFLLREVNASTRTMREGMEIALDGSGQEPPGQSR
jgi:hypothetical protein